jgi:hypothetical protein
MKIICVTSKETMFVTAERSFSPRYIRGGSLSSILQSFTGDQFLGSAKELGKSLFSSGKKFIKPILQTGYEALKPVLKQTQDQLTKELLNSKDQLLKLGADTVQKQTKKLASDLVNAKNKKDLKNLIKSQESDFRNTTFNLGKNIIKGSAKEAEKNLVSAMRDLPTNVGRPVFDKTQDQLDGILKKAIPSKNVDTSALVANIISGNGLKQAGSGRGKGLKQAGSGNKRYDFNSGQGLIQAGVPHPVHGRGLVRL